MYEYDGENVILMLCSKCNVNCKHCYVKYKGNFDKDKVRELLEELKKKYFVILNGTEPILFPEYYELFSINNQQRLLTNGLEFYRHPELIDIIKEYGVQEIAMSYHFGMQDEISYVKSEWLEKVIHDLREKDVKVKLMTTLSTDNYLLIDEMCKKAHDLGASTIKFTNYIYQGNAQDREFSKVLNFEQIQFVLNRIEDLRKMYDPNELYIQRCGTFGPNVKKKKFECLAGKNMAVITPDMKVYKCVFDIDAGNEIGYVEDNRIWIKDEVKSYDTSYCKVLERYNKVR